MHQKGRKRGQKRKVRDRHAMFGLSENTMKGTTMAHQQHTFTRKGCPSCVHVCIGSQLTQTRLEIHTHKKKNPVQQITPLKTILRYQQSLEMVHQSWTAPQQSLARPQSKKGSRREAPSSPITWHTSLTHDKESSSEDRTCWSEE